MKILIDENLPVKLKESFGEKHGVHSVREMNWHGKKNGELPGLMTLQDLKPSLQWTRISQANKT